MPSAEVPRTSSFGSVTLALMVDQGSKGGVQVIKGSKVLVQRRGFAYCKEVSISSEQKGQIQDSRRPEQFTVSENRRLELRNTDQEPGRPDGVPMLRLVICQGKRAVWRSIRGAAVAAALKARIEASMVVYIMLVLLG